MADDEEEYISCSSEEEDAANKESRSAPAEGDPRRRLRPSLWQRSFNGASFTPIRRNRRKGAPDTPSRNPDVGNSRSKKKIPFGTPKVDEPFLGNSDREGITGKNSAQGVSDSDFLNRDTPAVLPPIGASGNQPFFISGGGMASKNPAPEVRERALGATEALGKKEEWDAQMSMLDDSAHMERLYKWLGRAVDVTSLVLTANPTELGALGETVQQVLKRNMRQQDAKQYFSSQPLREGITEAKGLYDEIWGDANDVSNTARAFRAVMYKVVNLLENYSDAYSSFSRLDDEWLSANKANDMFSQEMNTYMGRQQGLVAALKRLLANTKDSRPKVKVKVEPREQESETDDEVTIVNPLTRVAPNYREPKGAEAKPTDSKTEQFRLMVAASVARAAPADKGEKSSAPNPDPTEGDGEPPDDDDDPFCVLCFSKGHTARQCPNRPTDGKGPYCIKCGRRGHTIFRCPHGRYDPPPCPHCGDVGHYADQCPLKKMKDRVEKAKEERTIEEMRLMQKAGLSLSSEEEGEDSEIQEIPRESPKQAMRRQLREKRELEVRRQIKKVKKEEEKFFSAQWADLQKMRQDIILLISGRREDNIEHLTDAQREEVNKAMVSAYLQQHTRPRPGTGEPTVASSLKELGIEGLQPYSGDESKLPVKSFIRNVDEVKGFKRWSNPVATIAMGKLLIEAAREWYEVLKADRDQEPLEYYELKLALIKQFYRKITVVEKAKVMASLKYDVTKHRGHLAFLTECERKSHLICDKGFMVENGSELITRNQAREEMVLNHFLAGAAPNIRYEVSHSGAETKAEVKEAILRVEEALRAKESEPRHALLPGYQANEVVWNEETVSNAMKNLGYEDLEINAVVQNKGFQGRGRRAAPKAGSSGDVIKCHYCATIGHKRSECDLLTDHLKKGTVQPDKCGPREGQPVNVGALSKRLSRDKKKKEDKGVKVKKKKKVNEVGVEDSSSEEEVTASPKKAPTIQTYPVPVPWGPWGAAYPPGRYPALPPPASTQTPESLQTSEVTLKPGPYTSPYDLI